MFYFRHLIEYLLTISLLSLQNVCYYDFVSIISFRSHINPDQIFIWWYTWLMRRSLIFKDKPPDHHVCAMKAIGNFKEFHLDKSIRKNRTLTKVHFINGLATWYFDGVAQRGVGGCRALLQINNNHYFQLWLECGWSTNTKSELLTFWVVLQFVWTICIPML